MVDAKAITLEELYDILRREKYEDELQRLDTNFYKNISWYLHNKKKRMESSNSNSMFGSDKSRVESEIKNIKRIVKEIYHRREKKIMTMAQNKSRTGSDIINISTLLEHEKEFFKSLVNLLSKNQKALLENLMMGKLIAGAEQVQKEIKKEKEENKEENKAEGDQLKLLDDVEKFVGFDMQVYGPYKKGQVIKIPKDVAKILIDSKKAMLA